MFPATAGSGGPPRPGVGPRHPSASHRAGSRRSGGNNFYVLMGDMPRSFSCRWDMLDVGKDCFAHFLPGSRESACGPPALWLGRRSRPRPAERRRLSCRLLGLQSQRYPALVLPGASVQGKRAVLHNLFPADAGSVGPARSLVRPVTPARLTARDPEEVVVIIFASEWEICQGHSVADGTCLMLARTALLIFFRGAASRPAGLPRYGSGCRSRPRPAERRRLNCRHIGAAKFADVFQAADPFR